MSVAPDDTAPHFTFCSPKGREIISDIVFSKLGYYPHDYQLDGVCKSLDGIDLLAILATGSGKTGFFIMYMLVLQELSDNPSRCSPPYRMPPDPAMVLVYPTVGLEAEMAATLEKANITSVVINHHTVARNGGQKLWDRAVRGVAMILLSPEMLASPSFETLVQNRTFASRVCALGVDEVHLCNSWGERFRPCFRQIGFTLKRLPKRTTLVLLTATLAAGPPTTNVLKFFGLREGRFHLIRQSNIRHDIQIIFRTLTRGIDNPSQPDFLWTLTSGRKSIIFCPTIAHGQRLALYLRQHLPKDIDPFSFIRTYNALKWADFNEATLAAFRTNPSTMIIIATDSLMVGVDLPNVADVILATSPDTVDEMVQKIGRAGRDRAQVSKARGLVYIPKTTLDTACEQVAASGAQGSSGMGVTAGAAQKTSSTLLNPEMATMIAASCKRAAQNAAYKNPPTFDPMCRCAICTHRLTLSFIPCNCSGCMPD
ncbi:P-loop containing nucleoside triphosphate hydrolase protein, partial [Daedaleopsis nitida]